MSGFRWVITLSWLSGSLTSFLYSSSVYSCYLFLISSASVRSILSLSFIVPIFAWNILLVSLIFPRRSLVFPILLFSSISLCWSLRKALLSLLAILWNSAFRWIYLLILLAILFFYCLFYKTVVSYITKHVIGPLIKWSYVVPYDINDCNNITLDMGRCNNRKYFPGLLVRQVQSKTFATFIA